MSVELHVEAPDPIRLSDVRRMMSESMRELLALPVRPDIRVRAIADGTDFLIRENDRVLDGGAIWLFSAEEYGDTAALTLSEVEDRSHSNGMKTLAAISIDGPRSHLAHSTVAALTVAIARLTQKEIADHAQVFTLLSTVERFVEIVRAREPASDLLHGADNFYRNLRSSQPRNRS